MTADRSAKSALLVGQLAREKAFRRWSNISDAKRILIALGLLAGLGFLLSAGFSSLDLMALR